MYDCAWQLDKIKLILSWYESRTEPYRDPVSQEIVYPVIINGKPRAIECQKEIVVGDRLSRLHELGEDDLISEQDKESFLFKEDGQAYNNFEIVYSSQLGVKVEASLQFIRKEKEAADQQNSNLKKEDQFDQDNQIKDQQDKV